MTATDAAANDDAAPVLHLVRHFPAPPEAVYRAFTDPEAFAAWWGPEGMTAPLVELDVRPGGAWRTCIRNAEGQDHCLRGVYREVSPPHRLCFTWAWEAGEFADRETVVTLEFHAAEGGTELRLTQEGFTSRDMRDKHEGGWSSALVCLGQVYG